MHNDHTIVGGARPNARAANQNNPGYTIKRLTYRQLSRCTRNILDNVIEAFQNYNQGVKYYVFLDVEFKKMLEDTITDPPNTFRTEITDSLDGAPNDINDQATQIRETLNNSIDTFIQNGSRSPPTSPLRVLPISPLRSPPTSPIRSQSPWSPLLSPVPPIYPPLQTPITLSSDEEEEVLQLHNLHNLLTNLHNTTSTTSPITTKRQ
eukprot:gene4999-74_t